MAPSEDQLENWRKGVANAVMEATKDTSVRMAMLMGAHVESNFNPTAVGDGGNSHGIFQINLPYHPTMNKAKAQSITDAVRYMLPAYQNAVKKVPDGLWNRDPAMAAATAAFYAERPAKMYGTDRVRSGWPIVNRLLGGGPYPGIVTGADQPGGVQQRLPDWLMELIQPVNAGLAAGLAAGGAIEGVTDFLTGIGNFFGGLLKLMKFLTVTLFLPKTWARVGAFIIGSVCVIAGLFLFFVGSSPVRTITGALK